MYEKICVHDVQRAILQGKVWQNLNVQKEGDV